MKAPLAPSLLCVLLLSVTRVAGYTCSDEHPGAFA